MVDEGSPLRVVDAAGKGRIHSLMTVGSQGQLPALCLLFEILGATHTRGGIGEFVDKIGILRDPVCSLRGIVNEYLIMFRAKT